ncbi:MAG: hypothetical protein ACLUNZ_05910 [Evtepia sp.]
MTGFVTLIVLFSLYAAAAMPSRPLCCPASRTSPCSFPKSPCCSWPPSWAGCGCWCCSLPSSRPSATTGTGKELTKLQDLYDQRTQELGQLDQGLAGGQNSPGPGPALLRRREPGQRQHPTSPRRPRPAGPPSTRPSRRSPSSKASSRPGGPLLIDAELDELQSTIYRHQTDYDALEIAMQPPGRPTAGSMPASPPAGPAGRRLLPAAHCGAV